MNTNSPTPPSAAPTPETLPTCGCDEMWPGKGHNPKCPVLRVFDELARERDEARAELAKLNKMRTHCKKCGGDYMATGLDAGAK